MRSALALMLLVAAAMSARAEDPVADFAGETFHLDYHDRAKHPDGSAGDGVAEFTLEGETVNDWTKLRERMVDAMSHTDAEPAREYFAGADFGRPPD